MATMRVAFPSCGSYQSRLRTKAAAGLFVATYNVASALSSLSFTLRDPTILMPATVESGGKSFDILNPAGTEKDIIDRSAVIASLNTMDREDARPSIDKSEAALKTWRDKTTGLKRSQIISRWSELIKENCDDLAKIITLESGKPIAESHGEVAYGASFLDYYAAEAIRTTSSGGGFIAPSPFSSSDGSPRGKVMAIQEAVGVTAMITPWNFPIAMITRKVGPALAAGCTVILKPSELTPLTAIAVQALAQRAGLPEDVFQLLTADRESTPEVGHEFCTNKIVKKISFTGSTAVGRLLMKLSSSTIKRLSLELGGNAPFIVFDDANIETAVTAAVASKYRNAGQTCVCADRFIIHSSVESRFLNKLYDEVSKFHVGPGIDPKTTMGPLITESAVHVLKEKVEEALAEGSECMIGGSPIPDLGPNFFQPTILRNVQPTSKIWRTETFGPVASISTFDTEEEAIDLANDTNSGLAAYFCTQDMSRIFRVSSRLQNGIVGINDGIISTAMAPFGGVKESGLGREGSALGIAEYLETKYMFLNV